MTYECPHAVQIFYFLAELEFLVQMVSWRVKPAVGARCWLRGPLRKLSIDGELVSSAAPPRVERGVVERAAVRG
jgi:hypothetical protein